MTICRLDAAIGKPFGGDDWWSVVLRTPANRLIRPKFVDGIYVGRDIDPNRPGNEAHFDFFPEFTILPIYGRAGANEENFHGIFADVKVGWPYQISYIKSYVRYYMKLDHYLDLYLGISPVVPGEPRRVINRENDKNHFQFQYLRTYEMLQIVLESSQ